MLPELDSGSLVKEDNSTNSLKVNLEDGCTKDTNPNYWKKIYAHY